ncbi:MAG: hypothetical protein KDA24_07135 [Deltaproteobacteria bacterium]|nr:hypothetical protein [Deltaproteobacteria bacterium]
MSRKRVLRVLFVRPAAGHALQTLLGFDERRDPASVLPVGLLRLATTAKLGSRHRVFVHDARRDRAGNRSTRAVASVTKAEITLVEMQLPLLADGLEAARAAREGGSRLVLGTGPLVARWPESLAGMPEFDGLLHPGGAPSLLSLLESAETDSLDAASLVDALALSPGAPAPEAAGTDRRLLDYAAYRLAHDAQRAGRGHRVDKGRHAASPLLLEDEAGALRTVSSVRAELEECALLGIPNLALRTARERPTAAYLTELLAGGGRRRVVLPRPFGAGGDLEPLTRHGATAIDLGDISVGDPSELDEIASWVDAARSAGLVAFGRACFGQADLEAEERGLERLRRWDLPMGAVLTASVPPEAGAARAWSQWLSAPRPDFVPPTPGGHRTHELAERARVLLAEHDQRGARAFVGRLAKIARRG